MLAIAQSQSTYYYLNWIPSEQGPLVTHHGSIQKEVTDIDGTEQHYFEILNNIFLRVENEEPICTFSLDRKNILFSTCFAEEMNQEMINWHFTQSMDEQSKIMMDIYHYPMNPQLKTVLNISIPKIIRQSLLTNMRLLKSRMNGLSVGIFSAEVGARKWMKADNNISYLIWKIGKIKQDELLYVNNGELTSYFCFQRKGNNGKILWQYGDAVSAELIVQDIVNIQNKKTKKFNSSSQVYLYTSESNINDVKKINEMQIKNLTLLNPLSVLKTVDDGKLNEYNMLPFAETGIAFRGIDV